MPRGAASEYRICVSITYRTTLCAVPRHLYCMHYNYMYCLIIAPLIGTQTRYSKPINERSNALMCRLANRPGIPGIVPEIVLLSWHPGNLPNVLGSLANWLRFQAPVSVYDIHTIRNATALGKRRQPHAVLHKLQNVQLT